MIRCNLKRKARQELDRKLLEALDSGPSDEMTRADWQYIRSTVRQSLGSKNKKKV
jgi:hypothetical protein